MKKKGFTLVELLAVIAILAILVIIALPNVMGMFNNAKKSSFETEVKNIIKYAGTEWMSKSLGTTNGAVTFDTYTGTGNSYDAISTLDTRTDLKYSVSLDASGRVIEISVYDKTFAYYKEATSGMKAEDVKTADIKVVADMTNGAIAADCAAGAKPSLNADGKNYSCFYKEAK